MTHAVIFVDETADIGGHEHVLATQAIQLRRWGWNVSVVLPGQGPLHALLVSQGVPVRIVPRPAFASTSFYLGPHSKLPNPLALVANALPGVLWAQRLRADFLRAGPAVVHSISMWTHVWASVAARLAGYPLVWDVQDIVAPDSGFGLYRLLLQLWARWLPQRILAVSDPVADQFGKNFRLQGKVQVLWNTVDLDRFTPRLQFERLFDDQHPLVIGTVARLTPWKGQEVALQTARILKDLGVPFRWLFAGTAALGSRAYQDYLLSLTREWDLEDVVAWLGWVSDMPAFYRQLDVLVHVPLEPDPCPLTLTEAMASGLVIISSSGGAADRLVPAAGGDLVSPNQPEAVAERLVAASRDPAETVRRGRIARRFAEATFSMQRYVDQLIETYTSLDMEHGHGISQSPAIGHRPRG